MDTKCPNCSQPVEGHAENGCILAAMIQCLRDRGDRTPEELMMIHATCDIDALWDTLGTALNELEDGRYSPGVPERRQERT